MCRINSNPTPITNMKEITDTKISEKIKNVKIDDSTKPTICPTTSLNPDDGFNGGCIPPNSRRQPPTIDLGEIIGKINKFDPKEMVDKLRSGDVDAKLDFKSTIDGMSKNQLKSLRDYLIKEMSSPDNKDDEFLGNLLNRVNEEIDSRPSRPVPMPIVRPKPFPEPIICGPFPWERPDIDGNVLFKKSGGVEPAQKGKVYDLGLEDSNNKIKE